MQLHGIRAITFDAAGTLVEANPSVGAIYAEIGRAHGLPVEDAVLQDRFRTAFKASPARARTDEQAEKAYWQALAAGVFAPWADAARFDALFPELWETFAEARRWRPCGDVAGVLTLLAERGFRLAVLSNWDARLHRVIEGHGWRSHFAGVYISSELGAEKPDRAVFDRVGTELGCAPAQILHVGDSWTHDVEGARAAGWHAAWLDHRGATPAKPGVLHLRSLEELPNRLA